MTWFVVNHIGSTALLSLRGEIGFGADVSDVQHQIDRAEQIELSVNSHGGCGHAAEALFQSLKGRCPCARITGYAGSSAALITTAAEKIQIVSAGRMMLHPPSASVFATSDEMRRVADSLDDFTSLWIDRLVSRTGATAEKVRAWFSGPDFYFSASEALAAGLADEIFTPAITERGFNEKTEKEMEQEFALQASSVSAEGGEEFFFKVLQAHGPVRTSDRNRLMRELGAWAAMNVKEL